MATAVLAALVALVVSARLASAGLAPDARAVAGAGLSTIAMAALLRTARGGASVAGLVALVPVLELAVLHQGLNPTAPVGILRDPPPLAEFLRAEPHGRIYTYDYLSGDAARHHLGHDGMLLRSAPFPWASTAALRAYLYPHTLGSWGLESAFERDSGRMQSREVEALDRLLRQVEGTPGHLRLLQLGGVTHAIALHESTFRDLVPRTTIEGPFQEPIRVYRVPGTLPRTWVASTAREAEGDAALATLVAPGFDPRREVVVDPGAARTGAPAGGPAPAATEGGAESGQSRVVEEAPDRVVIEADLDRAGFVVLDDAHDPDWRVRVDGRPAELRRADVVFRAVWLPAGHHRIEQVYRPRSLWVSSALTLAAGALGLGVLVSAARPRPRVS
jgi:hypothetical protein